MTATIYTLHVCGRAQWHTGNLSFKADVSIYVQREPFMCRMCVCGLGAGASEHRGSVQLPFASVSETETFPIRTVYTTIIVHTHTHININTLSHAVSVCDTRLEVYMCRHAHRPTSGHTFRDTSRSRLSRHGTSPFIHDSSTHTYKLAHKHLIYTQMYIMTRFATT